MDQHKYTHNKLPHCLGATEISDILGISLSATYELMNRSDFPVIRIGRRMVSPADKFEKWMKDQVNENQLYNHKRR